MIAVRRSCCPMARNIDQVHAGARYEVSAIHESRFTYHAPRHGGSVRPSFSINSFRSFARHRASRLPTVLMETPSAFAMLL